MDKHDGGGDQHQHISPSNSKSFWRPEQMVTLEEIRPPSNDSNDGDGSQNDDAGSQSLNTEQALQKLNQMLRKNSEDVNYSGNNEYQVIKFQVNRPEFSSGRIFTPHFDENEQEPEESPPVESSKKHDPSDGSNSNSNSTGSDDSLGNGEYIETIERDSEFFEETNGSVKNEPDQNLDNQGSSSSSSSGKFNDWGSSRQAYPKNFNPATAHFTEDELKPTPISRKAQKKLVKPEDKDEKYWQKRKKNNAAAKRSREARRSRENQIAMRAGFLEADNAALKEELLNVKEELQTLKEKLLVVQMRAATEGKLLND
ncbi:Oidioi.mRNA.OKI2018_I69.PAR.g9925.t2.cds [Oikopleura dioica]|uniref:Oidioi.mRNA.OKI2018_I69.PAR.g9925.t2.cds n=1 Tax=Oikopleura dioica TaxID=34765 RepID=A0ABN7RQW7_OIKDI|nr:Oidioi.mRNA.OKI2018_I69.PAR.g9925.t2.cds [Oikopleura dioica]